MRKNPRYIRGEMVAVVQRGMEVVPAEELPHRIVITNVRQQRPQDISDADCYREGIRIFKDGSTCRYGYVDRLSKTKIVRATMRDAFSALIDALYGEGTWEANPEMVVYDFIKIVEL